MPYISSAIDQISSLIAVMEYVPSYISNKLSKPGISIALNGPKENPMAFGSSIQIEYLNGDRGPKREIRSGAGYLSQDSPVQILGFKENPKFIHTIWPDGKMKKLKITKMQIALNYDD